MMVAGFNANPFPVNWEAVLKIYRYLKCTGPLEILYKNSPLNVDNQLVMFRSADDVGGPGNPIVSDYLAANFTRDVYTRRSISGFIFVIADAPISWQSRAQATVDLSSTKK